MLRPVALAIAACFLFVVPCLAKSEPVPSVDDLLPSEVEPVPAPGPEQPWVEVHRQTGLWSGGDDGSVLFGLTRPGARYQIAKPQAGQRLHVWDPRVRNYAFLDALDVGPSSEPVDEPREDPQDLDPIMPQSFIWSGVARVTMYTCVELGGCNYTRMGIWPYEGVVAVDPRVIPLGATVWLDGLGHFLAADTGSLVRGNHIDVFVWDYSRARRWGVQYLSAAAYLTP